MIEYDLIDYLKKDIILKNLIGATASDFKMYAVRAPQNTVVPFIVYDSVVGGLDETLDEDRIQLTIVGDIIGSNGAKKKATDIRDRLKTILDLQDKIYIPSLNYKIYYSKLTSSDEIVDDNTDRFIEVMHFNIKYKTI